MVNTSKSVHREDNVRDEILSKNTRVLLPTFEAALAGEISYGTNMSVSAPHEIKALQYCIVSTWHKNVQIQGQALVLVQ